MGFGVEGRVSGKEIERTWAGADILLKDKSNLTSNTKTFPQATLLTAVGVFFVFTFKAK